MAPGGISEFWTQLQSMKIYGLEKSTPYAAGEEINIEYATYIKPYNVPDDCTLTTENNGGVWIFISSFAEWFHFSVSRICNVLVTPDPNVTNITGVKFVLTILPPDPNIIYLKKYNDAVSAQCLGEWLVEFLKQYNPAIVKTFPMAFVYDTYKIIDAKCKVLSPEAPTEDPTQPPTQPPTNETFATTNMSKKILSGIKFTNVSGYYNENYSGVSGNVGSTIVSYSSPSTLFEYLFMYCYPVCFIGSIFFAITSVVSIDPSTIIANNNLSIGINIYILSCSIVAMFVWYNMDNPVLVSSVLNPKVIRVTLN